MKTKYFILLFLTIPLFVKAQNIVATYKVSQDIFGSWQQFEKKKIATLESKGFFYKKANEYLYFEKPSYLSQYPNGQIELKPFNYNVQICMDSVQRLSYVNMDSLVRIYRAHTVGTGKVDFNFKQRFPIDYFEWEFFNETKDVNGLKCQKAQLKIKGNLQWVVWFAPSIPTQAGIRNIIGLPGLVVSAEHIPINAKYELLSYTIGTEINDQIFEPKEFSQPYSNMPDLKKGAGLNGEKSKIQKQAEISNQ